MINEINQKEVGAQYYLKMKINDIVVPTKNIQSFVMREWIFDHILSFDCTIYDTGVFVEQCPLYDESVVNVEFSKNDDKHKITLDFYVNDFEIERQGAGDILYGIRFTAIQKTEQLTMPVMTRVFPNNTVSSVLGEIIAPETEITYEPRVESKDMQGWYQIATSNVEFIHHLKKRSYVGDEDMPFVYMTRNKNMVYTSLRTECAKESKFNAYNNDSLSNDNGQDPVIGGVIDKEIKKNKVKTIYYKSQIKYKTIAGTLNKENGYGVNFSYYDSTDFYYHYLNFNYGPMSKYVNENKRNSKKIVNSITYNTLHKNVHSNYLVGITQNMYLGHVFFNSYIQIAIGPDLSVHLFDKINVSIPDALGQIVDGKPMLDKVHSGEYIVGGILHDIKKDGMYTMILTLFRNGVNDSDVKDKKFELMESSK